MNLKEFKNLILSEQTKIINDIKYKFLEELKNQETISNEMNIVQSTIRKILEMNNIKRTKEQVAMARKKYNLEKYGDENYCNANKIKESLKKSNFNFGNNSQNKIAKQVLKEKGLYSWCILSNEQKKYFTQEIIKLYKEIKTDIEICNILKITLGCFKKLRKEYSLYRSKEVRSQLTKRSVFEKYGVENVYQSKTIREKIKQTNLEKYGVEYSCQRNDVKEKIKQTKLERYGDENYRNDEKIKETCLEKYGVEVACMSNVIQEKIKKTNLERYGSNSPFGNKEIFKKGEQTKFQKYGNKHYSDYSKISNTKLKKYGSLQNVKKINKTCQEKYDVEWPCQLPQCINKSNSISKVNQNFANLLQENNISFEQEFILGNRKFDFKIKNTLVEINLTYTHNSTIGCGFNGHYENPLSKKYHLEKSKLAIKMDSSAFMSGIGMIGIRL